MAGTVPAKGECGGGKTREEAGMAWIGKNLDFIVSRGIRDWL